MAIQNIFVVGAGLMGSGIAQNAITSGYNVTLNDQRQEALERAKAGIERALGRDVEKGRLSGEDRDAALARLTLDATMEGAKNADLVIEAIFENLEAKQAVFSALEEPVHINRCQGPGYRCENRPKGDCGLCRELSRIQLVLDQELRKTPLSAIFQEK